MSGKAAVERIKNNMDPFYATGVVMMARTKEELTFNRGSLCRDGLASRKQWLREEQTLTSRDGGGGLYYR